MKTVTIDGLEFGIPDGAKFLSIVEKLPQTVGEVFGVSVYDIRQDTPKLIMTNTVLVDKEILRYIKKVNKRYFTDI